MIIEILAAAGWATSVILGFAYYRIYVDNKDLMMLVNGLLEEKITVLMASCDKEDLKDE